MRWNRHHWALASWTFVTVAAFVLGETLQIVVRCGAALFFIGTVFRELRNRPEVTRWPWSLAAIGGGLAIFSAVVRAVVGMVTGDPNPFPSIAEIPAILGYLCLIGAALKLSGYRTTRRDPDANIDAALVTAATAVIVFSAVLSGYFSDATTPLLERSINGVYNGLTLAMVASIARLAVGQGTRNGAWRLLAGAISCIFANELLFVLDTAGSAWALQYISITSPLAFAFASAAILHPEVAALTIPVTDESPKLSLTRVFLLTLALLTTPIAIGISRLRGEAVDGVVLMIGSALLGTFTMFRMWTLFRSREEATRWNTALAEAGQSLLDTTTADEIVQSLPDIVRLVAGKNIRFAALIHGADGREWVVRRREVIAGPSSETSEFELETTLPAPEGHPGRRLQFGLGENAGFGHLVLLLDEEPQALEYFALEAMCVQITQAFAAMATVHDAAEQRLAALVEQSSNLAFVVAPDSHSIVFATPNAARSLDLVDDSIVGTPLSSLFAAEDTEALLSVLENPSIVGGSEIRLQSPSGAGERWFSIKARDLSHDDAIGGIVVSANEVTDERLAQQQLMANERRFRALVQNASDIVLLLEKTGEVRYISDAVESVLGRSVSEFIGHGVERVIHENDWEAVSRHFNLVSEGLNTQDRVEFRAYAKDGRARLFEAIMTDMSDVDEVGGIVVNATDVTAERSLERDLKDAETIDALTLQLNRKAFIDEIDTALRRASISGAAVSIAIIDLDDFKTINDALGPVVADQALVETANRIRRAVRIGDVVARLSGDEFGVLMPDGYSALESVAAIERVLSDLQLPFTLDRHPLSLKATAGISINVGGTDTASILLKEADTALGTGKREAPGKAIMFEEEMSSAVAERLDLRSGFERALHNDEMRLVYQPIIDMKTGRIVSLEALARWRHPDRGEISPSIFIPIAEDSNTITPLGEWALRSACRQVNEWSRRGLFDFTVSVNMSGQTLIEDDVITRVRGILEETEVDPSRIIIEITETVLIDDTEFIADRISALRSLGVALAIDDFGTGYSSLSYLQRYEFDYLKIDRAFVRPLEFPENVKEREIVAAIISLARGLGATTIAEGIEGDSEHRVLETLNCDRAQGFLFHRPKEVAEIFDILCEDLQLDVAA